MASIRRKPKVVWLPNDRNNRLGVAPAAAASGTVSATGIIQTTTTGPIGTSVTEVVPIVGDASQNLGLSGSTVESLADVTQSAYRLRRVVGKIFVSMVQDAAQVPPQPIHCIVTCGFIILRTNPVDSLPLLNATAYDAQSLDNIRDPWIWRRSWMLMNQPAFDALAPGSVEQFFNGQRNNQVGQASAFDGPHVDAKTARIVSDEERLFLVHTTTALSGSEQVSSIVQTVFDLRILASMRSSQGNRRNASR